MNNEMMPCDQNCTRDMDGICDPAAGTVGGHHRCGQAQAKQERRAHLNAACTVGAMEPD